MTELELLSRLKERADHWEGQAAELRAKGQAYRVPRFACEAAARDFRRLQTDMEAHLDRMAETLLRETPTGEVNEGDKSNRPKAEKE